MIEVVGDSIKSGSWLERRWNGLRAFDKTIHRNAKSDPRIQCLTSVFDKESASSRGRSRAVELVKLVRGKNFLHARLDLFLHFEQFFVRRVLGRNGGHDLLGLDRYAPTIQKGADDIDQFGSALIRLV